MWKEITDILHMEPANSNLAAPPSARPTIRNLMRSICSENVFFLLQDLQAALTLLARCLICSYKSGMYAEGRGVGVTGVGAHLGFAAVAARAPKLQTSTA